jgi:MFS family permease
VREQHQWDRSSAALIAASFAWIAGALTVVTALGKQVYDQTGRELDLGLIGLSEFAPAFLLVLVTGAVADRFPRRRIAALAAAAEAVIALGLAGYVASDPTAVGPIFAIAAAFGTARAFGSPASRSLPADLVPPEKLPWLVARWSLSFQAALIVGPVLGGTTYVIDPAAPFVVASGLLVAASLLFLALRIPAAAQHPAAPADGAAEVLLEAAGEPEGAPPAASPKGRLYEAFEGLRFIRSQPVLLGAIALDLFAVLFGGAVALLPAIAEQQLGVGAVGYGWLRAAMGIGAGAVTLVLARRPLTRRVGRTMLVAVGVFGAATVVLGATHSYAIAFGAVLVAAGADALSVFIRSTLVPIVTPPEKRGRVLAVEITFVGASNELGAFESGVAGQLLGPAAAVSLGGVATIAIAAIWWARFPALRNVDTFPTGPEGAEPAPVPAEGGTALNPPAPGAGRG